MKDGTGRLVAIFRTYLEKVPFLKIVSWKKEARLGEFTPDIVVRLSLPAGEQIIIVEIKDNGQPRLAREAVNQLFRYRYEAPGMYGVFMAPYISSQAAAICEKAGIGYVDLAGNCHLVFGQIYIERCDWPNPSIPRRELRSLFTAKASRILSVLLADPKRSWKILDLAKAAKVSLGQASNVKKLLEDREWVERSTKGLRLSHPEEVLAAWVSAYSFGKNRMREYFSLKPPVEIETRLNDLCREMGISCALTGFSAAARLAPVVRSQRVMAYVDSRIDELARRLELKEVPSGANVSFVDPADEGVFIGSREIEGQRIVSPVQLYLDLKGMKGRGEEAAEAILERVIKPTW
ncbi:MAG: type IV toxin-antitoxin system AbiEi family antitoxin [Candidatus Methylomirabilia bacterium]